MIYLIFLGIAIVAIAPYVIGVLLGFFDGSVW